jgi:hypothetical protein
MHKLLVAAAALMVIASAASAQTTDSGTITGVHWGEVNNCVSVTLNNGNSYAANFSNNPAPGFLETQVAALGANVGRMTTVTLISRTTPCGVADPKFFGQLFDLPTLKGASVYLP